MQAMTLAAAPQTRHLSSYPCPALCREHGMSNASFYKWRSKIGGMDASLTKRIYRIYRELELNLRIRSRKRIQREKPLPLAVSDEVNDVWSKGFMHDQLSDGPSFRLFNIFVDFNCEGSGIKADFSLPAARVIRALEKWTDKHEIEPEFIQPVKPQQKAYVERYNRTVRYSWLSQYLFDSIKEVQDYATGWLWFYNHERPNKANGGLPPKRMLSAA
jgi:putative transposase